MDKRAHKISRTVHVFVVFLAMVAILGIGAAPDASATSPDPYPMRKTYGSKAQFRDWCIKNGGTFKDYGSDVGCVFPNGHTIDCNTKTNECIEWDAPVRTNSGLEAGSGVVVASFQQPARIADGTSNTITSQTSQSIDR